jgi:hypothetical protein
LSCEIPSSQSQLRPPGCRLRGILYFDLPALARTQRQIVVGIVRGQIWGWQKSRGHLQDRTHASRIQFAAGKLDAIAVNPALSPSNVAAAKCHFPGASAVVPNRVLSVPTHRIRWSGLSARYLENSSSGSPNPATRLAIFTASAGLTQAYSDQAESARRTDHFSQAASSSRRHRAKNSAKRTVGRWIVRDLRLCEVANGSCD